jgi:hypothetical protein
MKHGWTINAFWDVNNKKWRKWCTFVSSFLLNNFFGLPVLTMYTKCPNQVFMLVWSIYRLFVQNRPWKRDSLETIIFVNVCSTWSIVELLTRFETWITRNDGNGLSLFHLPYLITLMAYLCLQWTPNVQIIFLCLIGRSTDYLC